MIGRGRVGIAAEAGHQEESVGSREMSVGAAELQGLLPPSYQYNLKVSGNSTPPAVHYFV